MPRSSGLKPNLAAFLDMLGVSEGTVRVQGSDDGYNVIVGGELFHDYSRHPGKLVYLPRLRLYSSAAGRYQLLSKYFVPYSLRLRLDNFGPEAQDQIAAQQIIERGAWDDVLAGHFDAAVAKCARTWASLPGAGYGQHENQLDSLREVYLQRGGGMAAA